MLSVNFVMKDGSKVEVKRELGEFLATVFLPASASSAVSKRAERAEILSKHMEKIPALKESESIVIENDEKIVTFKTHRILFHLANVPSAIACNEAWKEDYSSIEKNPTEAGKKGRKASDLEAEFLSAL